MTDSTDMSAAIVPRSDQINADDLIAGPRTITIAEVRVNVGQEQPVSILFEESQKVYRPCKSMARVMVAMWGPDAKQYVGRRLTLYRDPAVTWGGVQVGGIRISHMSGIEAARTLALTATNKGRKPFTVHPLPDAAAKPVEPKHTKPDMNGPTLALVNTKGVVSNVAPAKWRSTLAGWFEKLPFDTARGLYDDNAAHIDAARAAGFDEDAAAAIAAWAARQAASEEIPA